MSFKYAEKIVDLGLEDCPPSTYKSSTFLAFRYIFEDLEHANNFLPIGIIAPARLNEFKNHVQKCQAFGLSFFADKEMARANYHNLMKKIAGKFSKIVGDHLASLTLNPNDGLHSNLFQNLNTHFTFHELNEVDLSKEVIKIESL